MTHSSNRAIRPLGIFANSVLTSRASVKALTSESNLTRVAIAATVLNKGSGPFSFPEMIKKVYNLKGTQDKNSVA